MKVAVEKLRRGSKSSTNTWVRITSVEGKNRQIRNVFAALGGKGERIVLFTLTLMIGCLLLSASIPVTVTRLIRISYGDYELQTIPPGMAIEVPFRSVESQKAKGSLTPKKKRYQRKVEPSASAVRWIRSFQ